MEEVDLEYYIATAITPDRSQVDSKVWAKIGRWLSGVDSEINLLGVTHADVLEDSTRRQLDVEVYIFGGEG